MFYPGRCTIEWPILKSLKIYQCGTNDTSKMQQLQLLNNQVDCRFEVRKIFPNVLSTISSSIQNLIGLTIHHCGNLEELFPYSIIVTEELREKKIVFPYLKYLEMEQLANLKRLCFEHHIEFPTLEELKISNCPELTAFIFDDKVKVPSLKKLKILSMDNLKMIWDNQVTQNFIPKLKSLEVRRCHKILTLLQRNICETFSSLETLYVSDCGSLKEVFDLHEINSEEKHSTTSTQSKELNTTYLSFENLQDLEVWKCASVKSLFSIPNVAKEKVAAKEAFATVKFVFPKLTSLKLKKLRSFYPGRYAVEGPVLRSLQLWDCGIPSTDDEGQMQHPLLVPNKLAFPCLEELLLAGKDLMTMFQDQDAECLLLDFKILYVRDKYGSLPLPANQRVLNYIGNVKYMWKQNSKLDLILPNFEEIRVFGCDSFFSLMPPFAFQNLTDLQVHCCDRLEYIVTFSMAKNLVKLIRLSISCCERIVEIVGNYGDVTGDKILFSNLKSLSFQYLPSLTSFCSGNFTLEFPSLEELFVSSCPNMKFFSKGDLSTPKLQEVKNYWISVELCPDIDVSTAIQQLHEEERTSQTSDD